MTKVKYFFDPNSLTYKQYKPNFWKQFFKIAGFLCTSFVIAILMLISFYNYFDSPKEKQLKREIDLYKVQFKMMSGKVNQLSKVLGDLEVRDDKIYRVIFEADPIPESIRQAGYGGVARYQNLKDYTDSKSLISLHKKVDKLSREMYIQSKSYDEISKLAKKKEKMLASIPAIQPISNKDLRRIASGFGYRIHPIYKTIEFHPGINFSAPKGTEIYATGDGVIEKVIYSKRGYGKHVVINHGFGYQTLYGHMSKIVVKVGQHVKRGELIGYVGDTGLSTAPHLHYEVIKNGKKINPINFFYNDLSPQEYQKVIELANRANQSFD